MRKLFLTLMFYVVLVNAAYAADPPLCDLGAYGFLEKLGYADYLIDNHVKVSGADVYAAQLPEDSMAQFQKYPNIHMFTYPDTGKLAQVTIWFKQNYDINSQIIVASKILSAIEGDAYKSDRYKAESCLINLLNTYQQKATVYYTSSAMNRRYVLSKGYSDGFMALMIGAKYIQ